MDSRYEEGEEIKCNSIASSLDSRWGSIIYEIQKTVSMISFLNFSFKTSD